uniref:Non-specific serine/threonine protein kinase n=1 Tax=Elaeophora elaphi TaxID=1147741 RepID=A0A0R3RQ68_9BILA
MEQQRVRHVLETIADPIKLRSKLLPLVEECGKLSGTDSFGWALLAKLVYACDQEMLKTVSSRIQKRLIAATRQPITVPLLHFIRSFLVRFQWLKNFNEQTLAYICSHAVDFAVETYSEDTTRLVSNIYALWAGTQHDYILIKAMKNVLNDAIVEENEKVLFRFGTAVQRYLPQFISTIFNLHAEVLLRCSPDNRIAINEWLDVARESAAILEAEQKNSIFRWLRSFLLRTKSCAYLALQRICSFMNDFSYPSEAYYEAVKEYVQLGPSMTINSLFNVLIRSASCKLNSQEYGKAYAEALSAMLELRPYLLSVHDVIDLQRVVCLEAFQNRKCRPALTLLNSLLAMNNELVPSPIQIAQSIFSGSENWCDEVRLGRALCSSISRPSIHIIMPQEDLLKKLNDAMMSDQWIHYGGSQNSTKSIVLNKSEIQSESTSVCNELVRVDPTKNDKIVEMESVENAVRKRVYSSTEKTTVKFIRIDSEHGEEMLSSTSESSQSLGKLERTDEQEIPQIKECTLVKQGELQDTAVVDATTVKPNSDCEVIILNKGEIDSELTVQQMMADFAPD